MNGLWKTWRKDWRTWKIQCWTTVWGMSTLLVLLSWIIPRTWEGLWYHILTLVSSQNLQKCIRPKASFRTVICYCICSITLPSPIHPPPLKIATIQIAQPLASYIWLTFYISSHLGTWPLSHCSVIRCAEFSMEHCVNARGYVHTVMICKWKAGTRCGFGHIIQHLKSLRFHFLKPQMNFLYLVCLQRSALEWVGDEMPGEISEVRGTAHQWVRLQWLSSLRHFCI